MNRTSQAVQWLGLHASTSGMQFPSLVRELRSHMPCGMTEKRNVMIILIAKSLP